MDELLDLNDHIHCECGKFCKHLISLNLHNNFTGKIFSLQTACKEVK